MPDTALRQYFMQDGWQAIAQLTGFPGAPEIRLAAA
jgi:hypothetical protein